MTTEVTPGPAEQPGERDLRGRDAVRLADLDQHVDDVVEPLRVVHRRLVPVGEVARALPAPARSRRYLPDSRPPASGLQTRMPEALVERERHQLVLGLARLQRVVDLLADEALQAAALGDAQRLHQLPGGVVRAADVADLAGAHQRVERVERLLQRRLPVPLVHLVEVDVVGAAAGAGSPRSLR